MCRRIVLCFDGYGDDSDVYNIWSRLKENDSQHILYLKFSHDDTSSWNLFTDGTDQRIYLNVIGAYNYLQTKYRAGDHICVFGISWGARVAHILIDMLFEVGLLPRLMINESWEAYHVFKHGGVERKATYKDQFCSPIEIDFVGIFGKVPFLKMSSQRSFNSNRIIKQLETVPASTELRVKSPTYKWSHIGINSEPTSDDGIQARITGLDLVSFFRYALLPQLGYYIQDDDIQTNDVNENPFDAMIRAAFDKGIDIHPSNDPQRGQNATPLLSPSTSTSGNPGQGKDTTLDGLALKVQSEKDNSAQQGQTAATSLGPSTSSSGNPSQGKDTTFDGPSLEAQSGNQGGDHLQQDQIAPKLRRDNYNNSAAVKKITNVPSNPTDQSFQQDQTNYLRTLPAVRKQCTRVFDLSKGDKLEHFKYYPEKESAVVNRYVEIIQKNFKDNYASIPSHSRWRNFSAGKLHRVDFIVATWTESEPPVARIEVARRLVDLCFISVVLDALHSEGSAMDSLSAIQEGAFSGQKSSPFRVDASKLEKFTIEQATSVFRGPVPIPESDLEGCVGLLQNLANAMKSQPGFFGDEGRPGKIIDYLLSESQASPRNDTSGTTIHISSLFDVLVQGLEVIWPEDTTVTKTPPGDVWSYNAPTPSSPPVHTENVTSSSSQPSNIKSSSSGGMMVPFHQRAQWLAYSLVEMLQTRFGWTINGMNDLTGLPEREYRNGGLFVELSVLTPKKEMNTNTQETSLPPSNSATIEWRAMSVILLDNVLVALRARLRAPELTLPQMLEIGRLEAEGKKQAATPEGPNDGAAAGDQRGGD